MVTVTCDICGVEFESPHYMRKICPDCKLSACKSLLREEQRKPRKNPNKKLMEQVKEASQMGVSYGEYQRRVYESKKLR